MQPEQVQPIKWPTLLVGGEVKTLKLSYAAYYQLAKWGFSLADLDKVPVLAYAAAAMGTFDKAGKWRSTGWERPLDLADALLPGEIEALAPAVVECLGKVMPEADLTVQPIPADLPN